MLNEDEVRAALRIQYPNFPWDKLSEASRAVNTELWQGPMPAGYWVYVDPLEAYEWRGSEQGLEDVREMIYDLPSEMYWDADAEVLLDSDPWDDDSNWEPSEDPDDEDEMDYYGPWDYCKVDIAEVLLPAEVYKMV